MNKIFKFTIILIILFTIAVVYYVNIWISYQPENSLDGDKEELAFTKVKKQA